MFYLSRRAITTAVVAWLLLGGAFTNDLMSQPPAVADQTANDNIWTPVATGKLSDIDLPPALFGDGWRRSDGFRIDDLDILDAIPPEIRGMVENLRAQLAPLGIEAAADYSVVRTEWPLNSITVRVFRFKDVDACRSWWQKKYQQDGWEKLYRTVEAKSYVALDSLEMKKRALAFGNVWMTTHHLGSSDEHIKAAEHILAQLVKEQEEAPDKE